MKQNRCLSAYLTVEAAMIMPIVLAVTIFVIYMMFFQYDRCLMEQDLGRVLVCGITADVESAEGRIRRMRVRAMETYKEKYLLWESDEVSIRQEKGKVKVSQSGVLWSPLGTWQAEKEYENGLIQPVSFVRNCRKIIMLMENE